MDLIDILLGPRVEATIEDGEGGRFAVSLRPRLSGSPVVRTTTVSFRRPEQRPGRGFGLQLCALRLAANTTQGWKDPIVESSIHLTPTAARNALTWIDSIWKGN